jgi:hypothetical protein
MMSFVTLKRALIAGGTAAILGGAAIGVAFAQQTPTPTKSPGAGATAQAGARNAREQQFLEALAKRLNTTTDKLKQAIQDARKDAGLHDHGGLGGFGGPGRPGGPGFGPGPGGVLGPASEVAARTIGITADQLRQELPGKSLADVAKAHNVDPTKVADAIKAELTARIDQAVANNRLSADRAAQMKQRLSNDVDQMMTHQLPQRPAAGQPGRPGASGPRPGPARGLAPGAPGAAGRPL